MKSFICITKEVCAACGKSFKASNFNYHFCSRGARGFVGYFCDDCIKRGVVCSNCGERVTHGEGCVISNAKSQQILSSGQAWRHEPEPERSLPQSAIEAIGYYVYALVDPRDNQIFYVGKGCGNRILAHDRESVASSLGLNKLSKKAETIRNIRRSGHKVGYYILRHNLSEKEAYLVESSIIDLLTYAPLSLNASLTNIAKGHHQWDEGIRTFDELCTLYDCKKLEPIEGQNLLLVSLNRSFKHGQTSLYDCARGNWPLDKKRASKIDYILGVYKDIVRIVIKVTKHDIITSGKDEGRSIFEGVVVEDSPYLNEDVTDYPFGSGGSITYIPREKRK